MSTAQILLGTQLSIGRNSAPVWLDDPAFWTYGPEEQDITALGDPTNTGVSIVDAVKVYVRISNYLKWGRKSAMFTVARGFWLTGTTYSIDVNGTTYTATGEASAELTVADLVAQINAAFVNPEDPIAVAVAGGTDGVLDTVLVYALGDPATATAPVLAVDAECDHADWDPANGVYEQFPSYVDATATSFRLWIKPVTTAAVPIEQPWGLLSGHEALDVNARGTFMGPNIAGHERLYVELYDVAMDGVDGAVFTPAGVRPRPILIIAPAIAEEE